MYVGILASSHPETFCAGADLKAVSKRERIYSSKGVFGVPEVKRSLVAGAGGLFRLPERLPRQVAMELILTGDPMSAGRAKELGFVNELVEPGTAKAAALVLAERIAQNAPLAVQ